MTNKLTLALIVSLLLNLFLIGFGAGVWYKSPSQDVQQRQFFKHGPKNIPPEMREQFAQNKEQLRGNNRQLKQLRQQIKQTLIERELDKPKLKQLFAQMNTLRSENARISNAATLSALEQMSYEERLRFIEKFDRPGPRGRFGRGK